MCGGDYLTNEGLRRAHCISNNLEFHNGNGNNLNNVNSVDSVNEYGNGNDHGLKYILAQNPGSCSNHSHIKREYQTVLPLSIKYNIPIDIRLNHEDNQPAADTLTSIEMKNRMCKSSNRYRYRYNGFSNSSSNNMNMNMNSIVVSWTHSQIPILFDKLGCSDEKYGNICTKKLGFLEFDTYFKLSLSCVDSSIQSIIRLKQNCNEYTYANTNTNVTHGY